MSDKSFPQQFCAPCGEQGRASFAVVWTCPTKRQTTSADIPEPSHESRRVPDFQDVPLCAECAA